MKYYAGTGPGDIIAMSVGNQPTSEMRVNFSTGLNANKQRSCDRILNQEILEVSKLTSVFDDYYCSINEDSKGMKKS